MSYRIEPNESVREALVRDAREQLDTGLHALKTRSPAIP